MLPPPSIKKMTMPLLSLSLALHFFSGWGVAATVIDLGISRNRLLAEYEYNAGIPRNRLLSTFQNSEYERAATSAPTEAPTTGEPTTSQPTEAPTTSQPTEAPTTGEPTTAAPTTTPAPTTAAPTATTMCTWKDGWGLVGYGERKGNPDYADGVKRREKIYGERKVCREITTPSDCSDAKSKRTCGATEAPSGVCKWVRVAFRKGRKVKRGFRCTEVYSNCGGNNSYASCIMSGVGCSWLSSKKGLDRLFDGECKDPNACSDAKTKYECDSSSLGCNWKSRKCNPLPVTCEGAKSKAICERVGIDNAV